MSVSGSENLVSIKSLGFGLETFAKFLEGLGFGSKKFGIRKKVSVSVSENLVSEKSLGFGFGKLGLGFAFGTFDLGKQVSVSVSENFASEKKSRWHRPLQR